MSISRDITERQRTKEEAIQSKSRYERLVNHIDGIVWEVDVKTWSFTFVSAQAERILGYPLEAWYDNAFWPAHIHPDDRDYAVQFCADETKAKRDHLFEYRMIAADGREVISSRNRKAADDVEILLAVDIPDPSREDEVRAESRQAVHELQELGLDADQIAGVLAILLITAEAFRAPIRHTEFEGIPGIYRLLAHEPGQVVLVEVPFYPPEAIFMNAEYVLNSTAHWRPLMNGYSGYTPESYREVAWPFWNFPAEGSIDAMRAAGVTHIVVHPARFEHEGPDVLRKALAHPRLGLHGFGYEIGVGLVKRERKDDANGQFLILDLGF